MGVRRLLRTPGLKRRLRQWRFNASQRALTRRGWYDPQARSSAEAIFIGGCSRSGTTLLREILDRHSRLACGVETALLVPAFETRRIAERCELDRRELDALVRECSSVVEFAERFYATYVTKGAPLRWVDKSPYNIRVAQQLLSWFPNARFLHIVRDGRDVACSLRRHPRQRLVNTRVVEVETLRPIAEGAATWRAETSLGLALRAHPRAHELRYEDLVTAPQASVRTICSFVGIPFETTMLMPSDPTGPPARLLNNPRAAGPLYTTNVGRWRSQLTPTEREEFARIAGELLIELGYEQDDGWVTAGGH